MPGIKSVSNSVAARAAMLAGALFAAGGVVQIVKPQRDTGTAVVGLAGHLSLGFFAAALIVMAPCVIALARYGRSNVAMKAAMAVVGGVVVLGITATASLLHGEDYGFFPVVASVTNAAWLFGSIVVATSLVRGHRVPVWVAIGLPVAWVASIPLATVGGGLIAGSYFAIVGYLLMNDALEGSHQPIPQAGV